MSGGRNGLLLVATLLVAALEPAPAGARAPPPAGAPAPPGASASPDASAAANAEAPPPQPPPEYAPPPGYEPPPPPEPPLVRRYGDRGTSEVSIGFGYSSVAGFLGAGGFRYFVLDGLAPGVEATYVAGGSGVGSYGLTLASIRFVPVRTASMALVLTGRGGRVFLADHADGWGVGAGGGVIIALGGGAGLELGYQFLSLLPSSFCADLSTCTLHGPVLGLRFSF